jgi:2-succinyl-6-hydroxy-2,4-cyclohexadiene-1-carboxylate synthase
MTTILLHGFWGEPKDWNGVIDRLPLGLSVLAPDLYAPGPLAPSTALAEWPRRFWHWLEHEVGGEPVQIVGYSMGARLALTAVLGAPAGRVRRALLISGRPHMSAAEHVAREKWEKDLAADFQRLDWPALETRWQEQAVFAGSPPVERRKTPALREALALSLTQWSPRLQAVGREDLRALPETVEWAFGALDQNYLPVAKDLQEIPVRGQITVIPEVGHRVIAQAADFICDWIKNEK